MSRPGDYQILVPDGWFRISLDPADRYRAITALVNRQFRGIDNAPHLRQQARKSLRTIADTAYAGGGIEMYVSLQTAAGFPLSASLIISLTPPHDDLAVAAAPDRLARHLAGPGREVTVTDMHVGHAVRVVQRGTLSAGGTADGASTRLDVHVPVPGSSSYLILSFSTPLNPLAGPMTSLFDTIAGTLRWLP